MQNPPRRSAHAGTVDGKRPRPGSYDGAMASSSPANRPLRRWRRRFLILAPILLALYALGGFFGVPWALQRWAVPAANHQLNGTLTVRTFRCNPFALSLTIEGAEVRDAAGVRVLGLERFYGNLQSSSLIRRGLVLASLEVDRPFVQAELLADGQLNLAGLAKAGPADPEEAQALTPPPTTDNTAPPWPRIRVGRVAVTDARAVFVDHLIAATPFRLDVSPLTFEIPRLDTRADHENPHRLHAVAGNGAEFTWEGTVFMDPLTSDGRLTVTGLDLAQFQPYVGRYSVLHLNQGVLKLDVAYGLAPAATPPRAKVELNAFTVEALRVEQDAAPLIEGLDLAVRGLSVDAAARAARLEQVSTGGATLHLVRHADGGLALAHAVKTSTAPPSPTPRATHADPPPPTPAPWTPIIDGINRVIQDLPLDWDIDIQSVAIERYALRVADASTTPPTDLRLRDLGLTLGPIRSADNYAMPFELALAQETTDGGSFDPGPGTITISGRIRPLERAAEIQADIDGLDLTPLGPYLTQAMPDATLPSGRIGLQATAEIDASGDPGPETPGGLRAATFTGAFQLHELRIDGPLDEAPRLSYEALDIRGIGFDHAAGTLDIETIEGSGLTGAVAFNLAPPAGDTPTTDKTPTTEPPTPSAGGYQPLALNLPYRVRVQKLHQTDLQALVLVSGVEPPLRFSTDRGELTVNNLDLNTHTPATANVRFATRLQDTGAFTLGGTVAPDLADLNRSQAKLDYRLQKLPLAPFSGFTARYLGRELDAGSLSLDNAVSLGNFTFDTVVPIHIEGFALGKKVKSPDAVKLPLDLAIAILKDAKGNITPPDVPVAGPLNDPSVSVGSLVWYAVRSLIESVVAAPFNLLGGALADHDGGGDDTAPGITFAPGRPELTAESRAAVQTLADALADRPALGLRLIRVSAAAGADERALKQAALRQQTTEQNGGEPLDETAYAQALAASYARAHPEDSGPAPPTRPRRRVGRGGGGAQRTNRPLSPPGTSTEGAAPRRPGAVSPVDIEVWALNQVVLDPEAIPTLCLG